MAPTRDEGAYSAFVSHASADADAAMEIVAALERKGLTSWVAPRDIVPGREYGEEILRGISQSKCFVLLVSEASNMSAHVRREVERAASKAKPIYPIRIEDVPPSPKLEYFVSMHHWLDALDGVLADHGDRLAAAIASDEEWVGNRVQIRRRRWRIGAGLTTAISVAVILAGVIFAPDVRTLLQDDRQRAAAALESRGLSLDGEGLARAMAAGNVPDLDYFLQAGISPGQLADAFSRSAATFFDRTRGSAEAMQWLKNVLAAGLDPNLMVPHDYYGREGIFSVALRSGNVEAVLALLDAGASPHAHQGLHLTPYSVPRFLFPFTFVIGHDSWTTEEKATVAAAVARAGAVIVPPEEDAFSFNGSHQQQYEELLKAADELDIPSPISSSGCMGRSPTPICEAASRATGKDWCGLVADLPPRVIWDPQSYDSRMLGFDIHHLLAVVDGKGYVLATTPRNYDGGYAVLEIAADGRNWTLLQFMSSGAGLGHCRPRSDQPDFSPDRCWRQFSMRYEPDRSVVRLSDYYDYSALERCDRTFPNEEPK